LTPERRRELAEKFQVAYDETPMCFMIESVFLEIEREIREECAKIADEMDCAMFCGVGHEVGTRIREGK
jgi:hypothetical protein